MSSAPIADAAGRARIISELDRNLLVEAGAGSGKTQKLAERMAAGIARGIYDLEGLAAVTFTRKAAAELRGRFQLALEAELLRAPSSVHELRLRSALSNLERFFAGTIHAFCARLLRERPVEAGVAPGFTELDDAEERLVRQQSWRDYRAQAKAVGDPDVLELLDAGITARQLDRAFETICLYEDVLFPAGDAARPDALSAWNALEQFWASLQRLLPSTVAADSTCKLQERAGRFARQWRAWQRGERGDALLADLLRSWQSKPDVTLKWWPSAAIAKAARQLHADLREGVVVPYLLAWRPYLYRRCVALLTKARDAARAERRRRNALSFNDLLIMTADVLRTNANVRRALQQKYRWLLVDEFQDTDPVQAEIMFLLAAEDVSPSPEASSRRSLAAPGSAPLLSRAAALDDSPSSRGPCPDADWRTVPLRPGALFVVGDPKQSIYRFRRADIDIYNEVRARLGGMDGSGIVRLTTNFRSVPGLCTWANHLFAQRFPAEPTAHAPMFAPLDAQRPAAAGPDIAVIELEATIDAKDVPAVEAERIARYIRAEVDAQRRTFGDFLVLTRKKKGLRAYAEALEALHVPIEVTGAGAFDESAEVREIALLLTALADPQDAVALIGVLRGPLFGLSDRDLFAFRQAGGYYSLFAEIEPREAGAARVGAALTSLRQWYTWTRMLPAGAALERILDDSGYLALAASSHGGVEAGDLLHAIDRVRTVVERGFTLADAADALAAWSGLDEDGPDESTEVDSLPLEPGRRDVVRLMNLHKAKGLEAEVVFLADPLGGFDPRVDVRILRDGASAFGYFQIVSENSKTYAKVIVAEPMGWADHEAAERQYLLAESDRLLYVAATRARDLLVLGRYAGSKGNRTPAWDVLTAKAVNAPLLGIPASPPMQAADEVDLSSRTAAKAIGDMAAAHGRVRQPSWLATSVTAEIKHLPRIAITPAEASDSADPTRVVVPDTASHRADAGMAWGTLVHGLLEHAMRHPSATRDDLNRLAMWLTVEEPQLRAVIGQAIDTVQSVTLAEPWQEARASAERHEEVPFAVRGTGKIPTMTNGTIDLVYRIPNGWRLIDYKTDVDGGTAKLQAKYDTQIRAYVASWQQVAGATVEAGVLTVRRPKTP